MVKLCICEMPSVLWRCWLGGRKGIWPVKVVGCWRVCLERGADLHMAQLMPLPLTVSCFSKVQIGFTFLVPAHLGSPGQRAIKRTLLLLNCRKVHGSGTKNKEKSGSHYRDHTMTRWHNLLSLVSAIVTILCEICIKYSIVAYLICNSLSHMQLW